MVGDAHAAVADFFQRNGIKRRTGGQGIADDVERAVGQLVRRGQIGKITQFCELGRRDGPVNRLTILVPLLTGYPESLVDTRSAAKTNTRNSGYAGRLSRVALLDPPW